MSRRAREGQRRGWVALHLPPPRERKDDVPLLARFFLDRRGEEGSATELGDAVLELLQAYDWPGNVRELENALEHAQIVAGGAPLEPRHLPERLREGRVERLVADAAPANPSMDVIERAYIAWVLQAENGNKTRAAEVLGIDPSTLYRKLNRYGIET